MNSWCLNYVSRYLCIYTCPCADGVYTGILTRVRAHVYFLALSTERAQKRDAPGTPSTGRGRPGSLIPSPMKRNWRPWRSGWKPGWRRVRLELLDEPGAFFFFFHFNEPFLFTEQSGQMMKHMALEPTCPSQALPWPHSPNSRGQGGGFSQPPRAGMCQTSPGEAEVSHHLPPHLALWAEREEPFKLGTFSCAGR